MLEAGQAPRVPDTPLAFLISHSPHPFCLCIHTLSTRHSCKTSNFTTAYDLTGSLCLSLLPAFLERLQLLPDRFYISPIVLNN